MPKNPTRQDQWMMLSRAEVTLVLLNTLDSAWCHLRSQWNAFVALLTLLTAASTRDCRSRSCINLLKRVRYLLKKGLLLQCSRRQVLAVVSLVKIRLTALLRTRKSLQLWEADTSGTLRLRNGNSYTVLSETTGSRFSWLLTKRFLRYRCRRLSPKESRRSMSLKKNWLSPTWARVLHLVKPGYMTQ